MRFPPVPHKHHPIPQLPRVILIAAYSSAPETYEQIREIDGDDVHMVDRKAPRESRRILVL